MQMFNDPRDVFLTINGFPLFGVDAIGSEWHTSFQNVTGLFDSVGTTLETNTKLFTDGYYSNTAVRHGRVITIEGQIIGSCTENCVRSWDVFKRTLQVNSQVLRVKLGGIERQVTVKQSSSVPLVKWSGVNVLQFSLSLVSDSAYLFNVDTLSGKTGLPLSTGGMTFPYHFENIDTEISDSTWLFSEAVIAGSVNLTSGGTASSPVVIRVDGQVVNPTITHVETGKVFRVNGIIGVGHNIIFDGNTKQILLDGSNPAQGMITRRQWAEAQPGTNTWQFAADEYSETAQITVSFREAFI